MFKRGIRQQFNLQEQTSHLAFNLFHGQASHLAFIPFQRQISHQYLTQQQQKLNLFRPLKSK